VYVPTVACSKSTRLTKCTIVLAENQQASNPNRDFSAC
jgi:hypothetical protein